MFQASRRSSALDGVQGLALLAVAIVSAPIGLITIAFWTFRMLSDPRATTAETVTGIVLALALAALPATALLLLSRRRADLAWVPAMVARRRTPFTPGPPDLVLKQAPGRLVAGIAGGWLAAVGSLVLALGQHPAWWLALAACLAVIARLTWRLRTRPVLSVSADGFAVRAGWRGLALAWPECAAFTATQKGEVQVTVVVDLGLKPPPAHAIRTGLDHRNADELAGLLSSYLAGA